MTGKSDFGSVRRLPSGRWQAGYWHEGRRHLAAETFPDKKQAAEWLRNAGADISRGTWVDPAGGTVTFGEFVEHWLATRLVKGRPLSPATVQGYRGLLRRNILPRFERTPLRSISPEMVARWHADVIRDAGLDQAAKSYRVLRAVFTTAVRNDRIAKNPCRIEGAGIERTTERPLVDTGTVLDLADTITPRLRALVIVAGFAGLRVGEMLALTRADVDLVHRQVRVWASAQELVGVGRVVGDPKSSAGRRDVHLPTVAVEALDRHLAVYVAAEPGSWVFTGARGAALRRSRLSEAWHQAVAQVPAAPAGLHVHDLRHHAATMAARMPGITTRELMARIGHSSARASLIYQHAVEERDREVAAFIDGQVDQARQAPVAAVVPIGSRS
jgi:integrase